MYFTHSIQVVAVLREWPLKTTTHTKPTHRSIAKPNNINKSLLQLNLLSNSCLLLMRPYHTAECSGDSADFGRFRSQIDKAKRIAFSAAAVLHKLNRICCTCPVVGDIDGSTQQSISKPQQSSANHSWVWCNSSGSGGDVHVRVLQYQLFRGARRETPQPDYVL